MITENDIIPLNNKHDDLYAYVVKGHVDKAEFRNAVMEGYEEDGFPVSLVKHDYMRTVPCRSDDFDRMWYPAKRGERGVFAVTVVYDADLFDFWYNQNAAREEVLNGQE